jgi:hypothetical protein
MQNEQTLKSGIISSLDNLPLASLQVLAEFATFLQTKSEQFSNQKRVIKLGGLWAGTPKITEADIAEARREMWGSFGEREL